MFNAADEINMLRLLYYKIRAVICAERFIMKKIFPLVLLSFFVCFADFTAAEQIRHLNPLDKALAAPTEKSVPAKQREDDIHVIIINPGSSDSFRFFGEWGGVIESRHVYNWGRSYQLYMNPDDGVIIDNIAGYISPGGRVILSIDGLKIDGFYSIWIDCVTFRNPERVEMPSFLKVFAGNEKYPYRELAVFSFTDIEPNAVKITIPYELSQAGKITILLEEYTLPQTAFRFKPLWAVWDIIIADSAELPVEIIRSQSKNENNKLPYKNDILR